MLTLHFKVHIFAFYNSRVVFHFFVKCNRWLIMDAGMTGILSDWLITDAGMTCILYDWNAMLFICSVDVSM